MAPRAHRRLLLITGCRPVSAVLFHGFGLPPWYDLPGLQEDPRPRDAMTERVNRAARLAFAAGYDRVDVHEAFPVNFMTADPALRILRGVDHFRFERGYAGFVLLTPPAGRVRLQPRLRLIRSIRLGRRALDEADILAAHLAHHGVPPVRLGDARPAGRRLRLPGRLAVTFDPGVPMQRLDGFPGVETAAAGRLVARARDADHLMDVYRYAGLIVQQARRY